MRDLIRLHQVRLKVFGAVDPVEDGQVARVALQIERDHAGIGDAECLIDVVDGVKQIRFTGIYVLYVGADLAHQSGTCVVLRAHSAGCDQIQIGIDRGAKGVKLPSQSGESGGEVWMKGVVPVVVASL